MKQFMLTAVSGLYIAFGGNALAHELLSNVRITAVEQTAEDHAVVITYDGEETSCVMGNAKIIIFNSSVNSISALNNISMVAVTALETGSLVQILSSSNGDCASANSIVLGAAEI